MIQEMADKKIGKIAGKLGVSQASNSSADEKDLAQIREILFGEQTREAGRRPADPAAAHACTKGFSR